MLSVLQATHLFLLFVFAIIILNIFSSELLQLGQTASWIKNSTFTSDSIYRNFPKFSDRQARANSVDTDQTVPRGAAWSGSTLFAIPFASLGHITLW